GAKSLRGADAGPACVFVFTPAPGGAYSRMFAQEYGVVEDPATGSSTGPLAAFMMRHGLVRGGSDLRFISEQGVKMGRRSILHVHAPSAEEIHVGGHVAPLTEGTFTI
ncbi:MAG: PhzF family phenazine biosynthesis protein, partial [Bryobacteraceae bacterium]